MNLNIGGREIMLIRSDALPPNTMCVSPDLFDILANDGVAAKQAHADTIARVNALASMINKGAKPCS